MAKMRINRALASTGIASRRKAEELVKAGRIKVNGVVVKELSHQVDPQKDELSLDNKVLKSASDLVYYIYHKPRGEICTMQDELNRTCIGDTLKSLKGTPKPVGRLDRASEGLLLLTNDGELANRVLHPRYQVKKVYQVTVSPKLKDSDAEKMVSGVKLEDGMAKFIGMALKDEATDRSRVEVTVDEGRNRLIRRVFERFGYKVRRLKRFRLATLTLGRLKLGESRMLSKAEIRDLKTHLGL